MEGGRKQEGLRDSLMTSNQGMTFQISKYQAEPKKNGILKLLKLHWKSQKLQNCGKKKKISKKYQKENLCCISLDMCPRTQSLTVHVVAL